MQMKVGREKVEKKRGTQNPMRLSTEDDVGDGRKDRRKNGRTEGRKK